MSSRSSKSLERSQISTAPTQFGPATLRRPASIAYPFRRDRVTPGSPRRPPGATKAKQPLPGSHGSQPLQQYLPSQPYPAPPRPTLSLPGSLGGSRGPQGPSLRSSLRSEPLQTPPGSPPWGSGHRRRGARRGWSRLRSPLPETAHGLQREGSSRCPGDPHRFRGGHDPHGPGPDVHPPEERRSRSPLVLLQSTARRSSRTQRRARLPPVEGGRTLRQGG